MARVLIGVGANLAPAHNIFAGLALLSRTATLVGISTFYRTAPWEGRKQPPFYNGVVAIETGMEPAALRQLLRDIEAARGRRRTADRYATRTLDLDIEVYDDRVIDADGLTIPDPEIRQRPFLAIPLAEMAPDRILPGTTLTFREVAQRVTAGRMTPLHAFTNALRRQFLRGEF